MIFARLKPKFPFHIRQTLFLAMAGILLSAELAQAAAPTASFKINGSSAALTAPVGDFVTYTWSSTNGATASAHFTLDSSACVYDGTGPFPWAPTGLSGSLTKDIDECFAGHSIRIYYEVKNDSGTKATSSVKIIVPPKPKEPDPPPNASPIGAVQLNSDISKAQIFQFGARVNTDSQAGAIDGSADMLKQGADHNATLGALYCAEGANQALQDPEQGGTSLQNCQEQFKSASEMQNMQKKLGSSGALTPDKDVLAKPGSQSTLSEFEANFGISGEEYMKRMLNSSGSKAELSAMVNSKLQSERLDAAVNAVNAATAHEGEMNLASDKTLSKQKINFSLRDKLRAKISQEGSREPASTEKIRHSIFQPAPKDQYGHLEPLENAFAAEEDTGEMTLFQVIHQKYSEVSVRLHR
jgi:hypothetical protein